MFDSYDEDGNGTIDASEYEKGVIANEDKAATVRVQWATTKVNKFQLIVDLLEPDKPVE